MRTSRFGVGEIVWHTIYQEEVEILEIDARPSGYDDYWVRGPVDDYWAEECDLGAL